MEITVKTNQLAIVSFICGLLALVSFGAAHLLVFLWSPENLPESTMALITTVLYFPRSLFLLFAELSLITGFLALREIEKQGGLEKGKTLAWAGIILGAGVNSYAVGSDYNSDTEVLSEIQNPSGATSPNYSDCACVHLYRLISVTGSPSPPKFLNPKPSSTNINAHGNARTGCSHAPGFVPVIFPNNTAANLFMKDRTPTKIKSSPSNLF
jgi:hypothetical protein